MKFKKIISFLLIVLLTVNLGYQISFAENDLQNTFVIMYLNNTSINIIKGNETSELTLEAAPYAPNGTTLVPIRAVLEAFGASLKWDEVMQQVIINNGDKTITITINSKSAQVGEKKVTLAEPARIINGRTMIPLRFVSENLGLSVNWYKDNKKIVIGNTGLASGVIDETSENYTQNSDGQKNISSTYNTTVNFNLTGNQVATVIKTIETDNLNSNLSNADSEITTTFDTTTQNSVINETQKNENGIVTCTINGFSNAKYDKETGNIDIVSNETYKLTNGETLKTKRIKAYIQKKEDNSFFINSSIYEYDTDGNCKSYFEEGSTYKNGDFQSIAQQMDAKSAEVTKYILNKMQSSGDKLIYNGIILNDNGILTSEKINFPGNNNEDKSEIKSKIKKALEAAQPKIDLSQYLDNCTTINDILDEYDNVLNENPDLFYCDSKINYTFSGKLTPEYIYSDDKIQSMKKIFSDNVDAVIKEIIKPEMTEFQKELAIHDYIVKTTRYDDTSHSGNNIADEDYTAYGVLINHTAVCDGYAKAAKLLCDKAGLECNIIIGKAKNTTDTDWIAHAWNQIKIDGKFYQLDVTWDDPIPDDPATKIYNYFNLTDKDISSSHQWPKNKYNICDSKEYNYFYMNNSLIDDYQTFYDYILNSVKQNKKDISIKIVNYDEIVYSVTKAMDSILNNSTYPVTSYGFSINKDTGNIKIELIYN